MRRELLQFMHGPAGRVAAHLLLFLASFVTTLLLSVEPGGIAIVVPDAAQPTARRAVAGGSGGVVGMTQPQAEIEHGNLREVPAISPVPDPADLRPPQGDPPSTEFAAAIRQQDEEYLQSASFTVMQEPDPKYRLQLVQQLREMIPSSNADARLRQLLVQLAADKDPDVAAAALAALNNS